ncbi:Protein TOS1 [Tolypocladium capitatum]|uniref:glucan endo-1,3-beta-D-glucosidase n=1 Tax=Tolypocladium capitatum TaxID=45235 RepID=A0A2K3QAE4_9HYPO|nr:Protein TOS1 [Tolypocladium capitatum]
MKRSVLLLLASAARASALIQQCSGKAVEEGGNWFCGQINHILYRGIDGYGSFKDVTGMGSKGKCQMVERNYSGSLAPLDQDVELHHVPGSLSIHIRGPFQLKEAAVYNKLAPNKKHNAEAPCFSHGRSRNQQVREPQEKANMVTAAVEGKVVTRENNWLPTLTPAPVAAPASGGFGGSWSRVAYYDAERQVVRNMVFMGNYGRGPRVLDHVWGSSVAYLNADGSDGAASPQILKDVLIPSNKEFAIFSAERCDASCGFSRAQDVAYKGFGGANKIFLFRFKMPLDGSRGFNGDRPALWVLNARIPRTAQYHACSCWTSGCGEADIYEVLAMGDIKCKSTIHLTKGGGSSDYFARPVDSFIRVAVVFNQATSSVSIQLLPDNTRFSPGLDDATVQRWIKGPADGKMSSLFEIS